MVEFKIFRKSPSFKEILSNIIYRLRIYIAKLENIKLQLKRKERSLFNKVVEFEMSGDVERAKIYANECAQFRRLLKTIENANTVLEQLMLRLETARELGEVANIMIPVNDLVARARKVAPLISPELENLLNNLSNILSSELMLPVKATPIHPAISSDEVPVQTILNEAATVAKLRMSEALPETPSAHSEKTVERSYRMAEKISTPISSENKKPSRIEKIVVKIEKSLEDRVYEWAKEHKGLININECAKKLGVTPDDVKKALISLDRSGRIKLE